MSVAENAKIAIAVTAVAKAFLKSSPSKAGFLTLFDFSQVCAIV